MKRNRSSTKQEAGPESEIEAFRTFLGPLAKGYNDAQLWRLRDEMYLLAGILLDFYLHKRSKPSP